LLQRACPAGVYEYIEDETAADGWNGHKLVINSQVYFISRIIAPSPYIVAELYPLQIM